MGAEWVSAEPAAGARPALRPTLSQDEVENGEVSVAVVRAAGHGFGSAFRELWASTESTAPRE